MQSTIEFQPMMPCPPSEVSFDNIVNEANDIKKNIPLFKILDEYLKEKLQEKSNTEINEDDSLKYTCPKKDQQPISTELLLSTLCPIEIISQMAEIYKEYKENKNISDSIDYNMSSYYNMLDFIINIYSAVNVIYDRKDALDLFMRLAEEDECHNVVKFISDKSVFKNAYYKDISLDKLITVLGSELGHEFVKHMEKNNYMKRV